METILIAKLNGQIELVQLISRESDRLIVRAIGAKTNRNIYFNDDTVREVESTDQGIDWIKEQRLKHNRKVR